MIITITGPRSVGKSTISKILAKKLNLKYYSSDKIGDAALKNHGGLDKTIKSGAMEKSIKKGNYNLIRDVFKKDQLVFDLSGGSISSKKYAEASKKVRKTAQENSIVIGLLPSKSTKESINFLFKREKERNHFKKMNERELFKKIKMDYIKYPKLFKRLCRFVIYVKDKYPEEIVDRIITNI